MTNLDEVKKEREGLENDLKSVNFDMTSKFLTALAQDGVINEEAISVTELDRIYGGLTTKVQESLKKQEELLKNIQVRFIYFNNFFFFNYRKDKPGLNLCPFRIVFLQALRISRNL